MFVFFTTVMRRSSLDRGGELVKLDWDKKKIVKRIPIIPFGPELDDPNPRGNTRGGRGLLLRGNRLFVSSYHSLHVFDLDLNFQKKISNGLLVGIHEIAQTDNMIWVCSTAIDAIVCIDEEGNIIDSIWPLETPFLQDYLSISPLTLDKKADNRPLFLEEPRTHNPNHLHLNAVAHYEGKHYALFNKFGIVYNLSENKTLIEDASLHGAHNLIFRDEYLLINDTLGRRLLIYSSDGKFIKSVNLLKFPEVFKIYKKHRANLISEKVMKALQKKIFRRVFLSTWNKLKRSKKTRLRIANSSFPLFVRGLFPHKGNQVLIGFSPATIIEIDYEHEELLGLFQYSTDLDVCPHGILVVY